VLTRQDWHNRYQQQASWTRGLRHSIFSQLNLQPGKRILEIGCGTGAITEDLAAAFHPIVHGVDYDFSFISIAKETDTASSYSCANAFALPFCADSFDCVFCHFFLLWVKNIPAVLKEMIRVTKSGGTVAALAEPDYGGRIDYPDSLSELGHWQAISLRRQGANPNIGRTLLSEFISCGLKQVESGLMGGLWKPNFDKSDFEQEWKVIEFDLEDMVSHSRLETLHQYDEEAHRIGGRILFVPTFSATGRVEKE
jgi:SAM-dependent methyltransferase